MWNGYPLIRKKSTVRAAALALFGLATFPYGCHSGKYYLGTDFDKANFFHHLDIITSSSEGDVGLG